MKKVYEAFVYCGEGLYFDEDGTPLFRGSCDVDFKRRSYIEEHWTDVFLEAFRDYCNEKNLRPKYAKIGRVDEDSWPLSYQNKNTTYVPVYFGPGRTVVFGIEEAINITEELRTAYLHTIQKIGEK